jgi:CBS domain-containing protein
VKEYVDFLGSQPPYDALTADELLALVSRAEVEYIPAGKTLVVAGAAPPGPPVGRAHGRP